ncbi:alpha-1A adrenergic receptor-like [Haliotis rubra]|uniref:alpha-1A adrenergic receptor-like n=1 Tax=Haliotis rubra TaxID=36100 RepID=UPI001EE4F51E|nr:alpha-1A adrenergic receptor-like [Haliotis rubra]
MSSSAASEESTISHGGVHIGIWRVPLPTPAPTTSSDWVQNASVNNASDMLLGHSHLESDNTNVRHDGTDLDLTAGKLVFVIFMFLLNIFMVVGNTISIVTIAKTPNLRSRTYYWLVLNLAIVDLFNSLTVVPINTIWELYGIWPFSMDFCNITICADLAFSAIASYSTVLVSIDKYLYITKPFLYHSISAPCVALGSMIAVWVIWITFSAVSVFGDFARNPHPNETIYNGLDVCNFVMTDLYAVLSAIVSFIVPFCILLFTSLKILCVARKHICRIAANHESVQQSESQSVQLAVNSSRRNTDANTTSLPRTSIWTTSSTSTTQTSSKSSREENGSIKRKFPRDSCRAFGTVMIVVLFFIIMFAPYWFASVVDVGCSCIARRGCTRITSLCFIIVTPW